MGPEQNDENLRKHGLSFEDAADVFDGRCLTFEDRRVSYGEERYITAGHLEGRLVIIAHTQRGGNTRIISMRKANSVNKEPTKSDLRRIDRMRDEDIDFSDIAELDAEFFATARVVVSPGKKQVTVRLDRDVLAWLKAQGRGYQTRINAILRAYYEAHRSRNTRSR